MAKIGNPSTAKKGSTGVKVHAKRLRAYSVSIRPSVATRIPKETQLKRKVEQKIPPDHSMTEGGIIVPNSALLKPVPASKLSEGLTKAKGEIQRIISEFASILTDEYAITEIEMQISFNADGKFLGFGIGGAASVTVKISPMPESR